MFQRTFSSLRRIKPKLRPLVKTSGTTLIFILTCLMLCPVASAEKSVATNIDDDLDLKPGVTNEDDELPQIEAKSFGVLIVRRSTSNRTYMMDDVSSVQPVPGRILLLKRESEPIMAFRVLKNYPEKKQFAAKRIRRYSDKQVLKNGESYLAIEKLGDINTSGMKLGGENSAQENADLKELEEKALPYDPELDGGSSPLPPGTDPESDQENFGLDEADEGGIIDDASPLDKGLHGVSLQAGYFRNGTTEGRAPYFTGLGGRYAITLGRMVFIRKHAPQDSIMAELGVFAYKVIGFLSTNSSNSDSYTVMPIVGSVRYNIHLSEDFAFFFYGGFIKNRVIVASNATSEGITALSSTFPAGGGGLIFRIGPGWFTRVDAGLDMIGAGLILRF